MPKSLFSENHIFYKQKRMTVYRRASIVLDFKLTRENDYLLFSRDKYIFEASHSVQEHTKVQIPNKKYQTNTVHTFWGTAPSFLKICDSHLQ